MANPTTNYGWPMPTSTDLVTDLPADFALFGQPVDTSLKALNPETTLGDIAYRSAISNTNTRLGIGSAGQVLTVASGVPSWSTPSGGGASFTLLNSGGTALTGAQDVTISGISGKNTIMIIITGASSASASSNIALRLNGSSTDTDYSQVYIENIGDSTYATGNFDANGYIPGAITSFYFAQMSGSATSQVYGSALIQGANTTSPKIIQMFGGAKPAGSSGQRQQIKTGVFEPAATISSITIRSTSGNLDAGTVYVYGSAV